MTETRECRYWITKSKAMPGHWDVRFTVSKEHAINAFDVGETEILGLTRERATEECEAMESLGYTLVSSLRIELGL